MKIVSIEKTDASALAKFCEGQNRAMLSRRNKSIKTPSLSKYETLHDELSDGRRYSICFAAYEDDGTKMIGGVCGQEKTILRYRAVYFHSLWVDPDCQGKGIAKKIEEKAVGFFTAREKELGVEVLTARVHRDNMPSRRVHAANGFKPLFVVPMSSPGNVGYGIMYIRYFKPEEFSQKIYRYWQMVKSYVKYLARKKA